MPVPPLIPMQTQQTNPLNLLMLMQTMKDRQAEEELRREKIGEIRRQRAQEESLGKALQGIDFSQGSGQPGMGAVLQADPVKGMAAANMLNARQEAIRKSVLDNPKLYEYGVQQLKALEGHPDPQSAYPRLRAGLVQAAPLLDTVLPPEYDPGFATRAETALMRMKGHGLPKLDNIQVGEQNQPVWVDPLEKKITPVGPGGPKNTYSPQWFENPDNPKEGAWVKPGQQPPDGFVPKSQATVITKETEKKEDKQVLAQMLIDNEMSPKTLSKRGDYNTILAQAKKLDPNFNPAKLELKWYGAQRWLASLSSPQQARMEISGQRVIQTVDELKGLSKEMDLSGFHPLNYVELESKMKMFGNTKEGQLATQYITAVNDLKELMATAAAGGYAPTESAWKLANQQVNGNFGVKQMHASLDELQRLMKINVNAGKEMRESAGGGAMESPGGSKGTTPKASPLKANYDRAKAMIDAMPEGEVKAAKQAQLEERRKQLGL